MNFPTRLNAFFKATGLKKNDLPDKLGVSRAMMFNYLAGRNEPSASFFNALKTAFPWLNVEWLITGVGEMETRTVGVHQVATGNRHIQVGGSVNGQVVGGQGNRVLTGRERSTDSVIVPLEDVVRILEDYVSPKVIDEIRERLKSGR
jgi:hypothetical protein